MQANEPPASGRPPELIADRYRVEKQLGRGGMAVVYQVHDKNTQRVLALKRLLEKNSESHVAQLFEREYQTLSQLVHPRIIEVYDYHTDAQGQFYTMELLSGGDLRQAAPIAWQQTCRLLCDVGSALALLHSRRFVHRDLTPLNVRCTPDGRAKLFDFGSMTQFGRNKHVVGTPPYVAPEALHGQALDGQTDLFALGATAYYALTGRHAYPARSLAELTDLWERAPAPPSQIVPGIPPALDELVLELLQLQAADRPSGAAVVMERLSAIGGFELQEALLVEQAYLSTPSLIGRDEPLASIRRQLRRASEGRGSSVLVTGSEGSGRSRFLDASALEAKLAGALVLRADLESAGNRRWGVTSALLAQLCAQAPDLAASTLGARMTLFGPLLASAGAQLPESLAASMPSADAPGAARLPPRSELQTGLRDLMVELARQRLLVLAVDDVDRIDEPSAALLALLANQVRASRMVLLSTANKQIDDQRALSLLRSLSDAIHLRSLDAAQTTELVVSLFGDVPNVNWLSARMHTATRGKPRAIMQVAQQLVSRGMCQYGGGVWTLPTKLDADELALALRDTIDPSIQESALELARLLAVWGPERLSSTECLRLSGRHDSLRLHADLVSLAAAGIVALDEDQVALSRANWQSVLLADRSPEQLRSLHLHVATFLGQRPKQAFQLVQHLLWAGEEAAALDRARALLQESRVQHQADPLAMFDYLQSLPKRWTDTFHALIAASHALSRPRAERLLLQTSLAGYATLTARNEREVMRSLMVQLRHDTGLDLIAELSGKVPDAELLQQALGAAQQRYDATPERERGVPLIEAITWIAQLITQVIGLAGRTFDIGLLREAPSLAPLAPLSPALAVVQQNLECAIELLSGRTDQARRRYLDVIERLERPDGAGLTSTHLRHMRLAVIQAVSTIDANAGRPRGVARAVDLETDPLFALTGLRLRAIFALSRGDRTRAEAHRSQIELLQIQNAPPQVFEGTQVFQYLMGYFAIGDLLRVKQCLSEIESNARDNPVWQPLAHYARGAYQTLRGAHKNALVEYELALGMVRSGEHLLWQWCSGAALWSLVYQGLYSAAAERGAAMLADAQRAELHATSHALLVPLSAALCALGQYERATALADSAIGLLREGEGGGVQLGAAYDVRARIALAVADAADFHTYADACLNEYREGGLANLLGRHERLLRDARRAGLIASEPSALSNAMILQSNDETRTTVATVLSTAQGPEERASRVLSLLGRATRSTAGFLYVIQRRGPTLVAQLGGVAPLLDMDELVSQFLERAGEDDTDTDTDASSGSDDASSRSMSWTATESARFTPLLLSHESPRGPCVTGVAVMWMPNSSALRVPTRLLHALSQALYEAGDALTQIGTDLESALQSRTGSVVPERD
jgi:eukaryotic-like serine/threonine-protein kinase